MTSIDLAPAAQRLAGLLSGVPDDLLGAPTPCPAYTLGDLVDHVGGLALAFTASARKELGGATGPGWATDGGPGSRMTWPHWRTRGAMARHGAA